MEVKLETDAGRYGCYLAIATGVGMFGLGIYLLVLGASAMPLKVTLLLLGTANAALGILALGLNRIAWSFALSLNATLGVVFLFGAPKIRDTADIMIGWAIAPAFVFGLVATLLGLSSREYEK
jgi:hypothetical protein